MTAPSDEGLTPTTDRPVALLTGTSSGIGRASALALRRAGFTVYATARRPEAVSDLAAAGLSTLPLDVTDESSMSAAVEHVVAEQGRVDVLVNNAGYALYVPVETAVMDDVRREFETNVFGLVRMTQLVLPGMRARRRGRIINIGSMGGRITFPSGAFYHASKHAVEAITDALRLEVAAFGVRVVLVQPGPVRSQFLDNVDAGREGGADQVDDPYVDFMRATTQTNRDAYDEGPLARLLSEPEDVAAVVLKAATTARPRPRYAVGVMARSLMTGRRLLPDQAWDAFIRAQYPTPRRPAH